MRGALKPIEGVKSVSIEVDEPKFQVEIDPEKVDTAKLLAALEKAGEPAKVVN